MTIRFLDDGRRESDDESIVEYVGGPLADRREALREPRAEIPVPDGSGVYRRSVRCADDGALRYVWQGNLGRGSDVTTRA